MEAGTAQVSRAQTSPRPRPRRPHPASPAPLPHKPRPSSTNDLRHNATAHAPRTTDNRPSTANAQNKPSPSKHKANSAANATPPTAAAAATNNQKAAPNSPKKANSNEKNGPKKKEAEEVEDPKNKIHVSGFPPYTQAQDVAKIFSRFGNVRIEKINPRLSFAVLQYATEQEANEAIQQTNKKIAIYGEFLFVRPYTALNKKHLTPKREFTKSKQRGEIVDPQKIELSGEFPEQVDRVLNAVRLTQEEATTISALYADLERVLQAQWPGCVAMPFGSITTGLGIKSSDADCYMHVPAAARHAAGTSAALVTRARRVLQAHPELFAEILAIPRANTPIVKFFHLPTSTNCDLSFKTPLGAQNSRLIAYLLQSDRRLLPLSVLIKYWAKVHNLSGTGKLTNYALTMLIIFYLQQLPSPILPPVESLQKDPRNDIIVDHWNTGFLQSGELTLPWPNTATISELLGGFFEFYSTFDFEQSVVCPFVGRAVEKRLFHDIEKLPKCFDRYVYNLLNGHVPPLRVNTPFVVQDPFEQSHNVASPISSKLAWEIQMFLKFAANAYDKEKPNACREFLKTILLQKPKITKVKAHPQYRFNVFPKLVQSITDPDWKSLIRKTFLLMFETMLQTKLQTIEVKVNPETLKEKDRYSATLTKPVWKRKTHSKLFNMMNLEFAERQAKITEEVMKMEKEVINIEFSVMITIAHDPKSAALQIKFLKGDVAKYADFGRFFVTYLPTWFGTLMKPHTRTSPVDSAAKLAETIKMIDSNLEQSLDSDDDNCSSEKTDSNSGDSESEKEEDLDEGRGDEDEPPSDGKPAKPDKQAIVAGAVETDAH